MLMVWLRRIVWMVRDMVCRRRVEHEMRAELETFLARAAEEEQARGADGREARRRALLRLGGLEQTQERLRETRGLRMETFVRDVRLGLRQIRRGPLFSSVVIVTLALGIGANAAVFSAVSSILLAPLPFHDSDALVRLFNVRQQADGTAPASAIAPVQFQAVKERSTQLMQLAAQRSVSLTLQAGGGVERVAGIAVTDGWLEALGVRPVLGRGFDAGEHAPGTGASVVLLQHGFWQRRLGADASIVGRTLRLNGVERTVIGIMPPAFRYPYGTDLWIPTTLPSNAGSPGDLNVVGRMRARASAAQLEAELGTIAAELAREYPTLQGAGIQARPFDVEFSRDPNRSILMLAAAVGLVLLIACANVANLMLARGRTREREIAVRSALGAGRARLMQQLVTESVLLAMLGGLLGVAVALAANRFMAMLIPERLSEVVQTVRLDARVLVATALISIATGVLLGLGPALALTRRRPRDGLGARGATGGRARLLEGLVISEVALATILLAVATLTAQNFARLLDHDFGYDPDGLLRVRLDLSGSEFGDPARRVRAIERIVLSVAGLPGVAGAGVTSLHPVPRTSRNTSARFALEGRDEPIERLPIVNVRSVTPGYFESLGVRIVRGRALGAPDHDAAEHVVVINEAAARRLWPGADPLGKRVRSASPGPTGGPWQRVVGIVSDIAEPASDMGGTFYLAYAQAAPLQPRGAWFTTSAELMVRLRAGGPERVVAIRDAIAGVEPDVALYDVGPMREFLAAPLADHALGRTLLFFFAVFGLAMAALGTYGVLAFSVTRRRPEMALRLALGAEPRRLFARVASRGLMLVASGLAAGLGAFLFLSRPLGTLLGEVEPAQPRMLLAVATVLLGTGLLAAAIPALRAMRLPAADVLRGE